jgi:hypothetical protein
MEIKVKPMTLEQYEKYLAFANEGYDMVNDKKKRITDFSVDIMKWIAKEIYGLDPYTMRPGTLKYIADKTVELTEKSEIEDEKNSVKSGIGE